MLIKTSKLEGLALDYAVAIAAEEWTEFEAEMWVQDDEDPYRPSTNWAQGGPIIEQNRIRIDCPWNPGPFEATCKIDGTTAWVKGKTVLIAAMRCFVYAKLSDEVDIPEELLP